MSGKLIVIEGLDGAGKSTQLKLLSEKAKNLPLGFLTFPDYESLSGKIITEYLNGAYSKIDAPDGSYSASCFYAVDRYISFKTGWGADYLSGKNFVSARYTGSNLIYQMAKLDKAEWDGYYNWLFDLEFTKLTLPKPFATIFLDMPFEVSSKLLTKRYEENNGCKDLHESDLEFLQKCKKAADYAAEKDNWAIINCAELDDNGGLKPRGIEDINAELLKIVESIIKADTKINE